MRRHAKTMCKTKASATLPDKKWTIFEASNFKKRSCSGMWGFLLLHRVEEGKEMDGTSFRFGSPQKRFLAKLACTVAGGLPRQVRWRKLCLVLFLTWLGSQNLTRSMFS